MWPIPPCSKEIITISFCPQYLSCCWFERLKGKTPYQLKSYKKTSLQNLELEHLIIFNPSRIDKIIKQFIKDNKLDNPFALFCLQGPSLVEQYIIQETATIAPKDFSSKTSNNLIWDYIYLYPTQNGKCMFYVASITRELLFQYQLLALRNKLNLISVTPATIALLNLYKKIHGKQFRQSQLGIDLTKHNHKAEQILSEKLIDKLIKTTVTINEDESSTILAALGLFSMRNQNNA